MSSSKDDRELAELLGEVGFSRRSAARVTKSARIRSPEGLQVLARIRAAGGGQREAASFFNCSHQLIDKLLSEDAVRAVWYPTALPTQPSPPPPATPMLEDFTRWGETSVSDGSIRLLAGDRDLTADEARAVALGRARGEASTKARLHAHAQNEGSRGQIQAIGLSLREQQRIEAPGAEPDPPLAADVPTLPEIRQALRLVPGGAES